MIVLNKDNLMKMGLQIGKELKQADTGTIENAIGQFLTNLPESILNVRKITDNIKEVQDNQPKTKQPTQQAPLPQDLQTAEQHNQKVMDNNTEVKQNVVLGDNVKANLNKAIEDTIRYEINGLKVLAQNKKELIENMTAEQLINVTISQEDTIIKQVIERFNSL